MLHRLVRVFGCLAIVSALVACNAGQGGKKGGHAADAGHGADGGGDGGGRGGTGGGAGGAGGLLAPANWRPIEGADATDPAVRLSTAKPGVLSFPPIEWVACGPGCERADLVSDGIAFGYPGLDTTATAAGARVWLSRFEVLDGAVLRRIDDLTAAEPVTALRLDGADAAQALLAIDATKSALASTLFSDAVSETGQMLHALYEPASATWELKLPWRRVKGTGCEQFSVDTVPAALLIGCEDGVAVLAADGSDERTLLGVAGPFLAGAGNAGLAVWSEVSGRSPWRSRIRTWSQEGDRLRMDEVPGLLCALSVGNTRIAGLRADRVDGTLCWGLLEAPSFWSVPREGGEPQIWPVSGAEPVLAYRATSWNEFTAVGTLTEARPDVEPAARMSIWLLRTTDGAMRRFRPSPGYEWRAQLLALDETHLYVGENLATRDGQTIDRIVRYRLDRFSEIGEPLD